MTVAWWRGEAGGGDLGREGQGLGFHGARSSPIATAPVRNGHGRRRTPEVRLGGGSTEVAAAREKDASLPGLLDRDHRTGDGSGRGSEVMAVALVGRRNASAASSSMIGYGGVTEDAAGVVLRRRGPRERKRNHPLGFF